jgi:MFS family permease
MAFHVRHPLALATQPGAATFSLLFFIESVARASMATVLPLSAYALFGTKEAVSLVYTGVSMVALCLSFAIPVLVRRISRRWTYTLGCLLLVLCGLMTWMQTQPTLALALLARTAASAVLNITLSLYIMDAIGKRDLARTETLRFATSTLAWTLMPLAGVWLAQAYGIGAACLVCIAAALVLMAVFWVLRLAEGGAIRAARGLPAPRHNPLKAIRRFVAQPRLVLAWSIAFARSTFWSTFFIYAPILMVEGGWSAGAGALVVAAGNLMLLNNLFTRAWAAQFSLRRVIGGAFLAAAGLVVLVALLSGPVPAAAGAMLVVASFFIAMLDGLGPVPFLRAVRTHERAEMTTVYRTYLDASELLPQIAYFFLFMLGGFTAAFAGLAVLLAAIGTLVLRHLPRGM